MAKKQTKRQQIEALLKEKKSYKEIATIVNTSYWYVANVACDLKTGSITASHKKWVDLLMNQDGGKGEEYRKNNREKQRRYKKNNPQIRKAHKIKNLALHQKITVAKADNHHQRWATKDIEYLEEHGKELAIHQLALNLGRSYLAVQACAHVHEIDLRGDKVGAGAAKFVSTYDSYDDGPLMPQVNITVAQA